MVRRAFDTLADARKYYHVTADFDSLPALDTVADPDLQQYLESIPGRQLIHITYGFMLGSDPVLRGKIFDALNSAVYIYDTLLKQHFEKHLDLLDIPQLKKDDAAGDKEEKRNMAHLGGLEQKLYTSPDGFVLPYCQYSSCPGKDGDPALIMLMHGAGEVGSNNWTSLRYGATDLKDYLQRKGIKAVLIVPQCPEDDKWVNVTWNDPEHRMQDQPTAALKHAMELLDAVIGEIHADKQRIYLTGISMGGFATWELLQRRPGFFAAAVPVCGGGDVQLASRLVREKLWVYHGGQDTVVLTSRSRDMVQCLKDAGNQNVCYTELPGVGHNAWDYAYGDGVFDWMFSQSLAAKDLEEYKTC